MWEGLRPSHLLKTEGDSQIHADCSRRKAGGPPSGGAIQMVGLPKEPDHKGRR